MKRAKRRQVRHTTMLNILDELGIPVPKQLRKELRQKTPGYVIGEALGRAIAKA